MIGIDHSKKPLMGISQLFMFYLIGVESAITPSMFAVS